MIIMTTLWNQNLYVIHIHNELSSKFHCVTKFYLLVNKEWEVWQRGGMIGMAS